MAKDSEAVLGERRTDPVEQVLIVVPLFQGEPWIKECLDALLATRYPRLSIVVVDDGSADAGPSIARRVSREREGRIDVIATGGNRGFAAAVNRGVEWGAANPNPPDVVALVNQDCVVSQGWLEPLVKALRDATVAIVGARLLDADGITLQHAGARIEANGLTTHLGRGSRDPKAWREPNEVDYVCGALFALRLSTWTRLGPLDEGYAPAYFEEVDLCVRARREGGKVLYVPESQACHLEASASGVGSDLFLRRYHRSRMRFVVRHTNTAAGAVRWLGAEAAWLVRLRRWSEIAPVLRAYVLAPSLCWELARDRHASRADKRVAPVKATL